MNVENFSRKQILFWAVVIEGGLIVVAVLFGLAVGVPAWSHISLDWGAPGRGLLVTLPMLAGFFVCFLLPVGPLARIKEFVDQVIGPLFAKCSVAELALISVLAGIGEELLFRGVLQPALAELIDIWLGHNLVGIWISIVVVGILFGLLHSITPTYALLAAIVGVYLGIVAHLPPANVLDVIIAHALYDFVALVVIVRFSGKTKQREVDDTTLPVDSSPADDRV